MTPILDFNHSDPIIIDKTEIFPGEQAVVDIKVGRLPSDTRINIVAHIFRSENPGPVILVQGGVHGDEINGVEIVRKSVDQGMFNNISKGTIIAIPLLNVFGFINFSREVPDGKDVNRNFPGSSKGSLASRVARTLTKKIIPYVDVAIDYHTGGASRYNYPQIRLTKGDEQSLALAQAFNAPYIIEKPVIPKSFRKVAHGLGIATLVYEGGESVRLDGYAIDRGYQGLRNVLRYLNMDSSVKEEQKHYTYLHRTFWIRSPHSGLFIWSKKSGNYVKKGEPLGMVKSPFGGKEFSVYADRDGHIIGHNNASVVNAGDALFHIGQE